MERRIKERLTGAVVLMLLAVIFIPMILDNSAQDDIGITETNIPPAPDIDFESAIVPVEELAAVQPPPLPLESLTPPTLAETVAPPTEAGQQDLAVSEVENPGAVMDSASQAAAPAVAAESLPEELPADKSDQPAVTQSADNTPRSMSAWVVQLGSFSSQANADSLVRRLQTNGFPGYVEQVKSGVDTVYKVRVGPELSRTQAENIQKNLKSKLNLDAIILRFP